VTFILSPSLHIDSYNYAKRLLHDRTHTSALNTAHSLASTIHNLCLSNLNHIISYTLYANIYDREKREIGELLGFVLGFGVMARQHR
jgi:hypothetical protein